MTTLGGNDGTLWWPPGHTMSGRPDAVVFEPRVGGRIYERDSAGAEHTWGEILVWDPPARFEVTGTFREFLNQPINNLEVEP